MFRIKSVKRSFKPFLPNMDSYFKMISLLSGLAWGTYCILEDFENLALFLDCSSLRSLRSFPNFSHSPLFQIIIFILNPPLNYFKNFPEFYSTFWTFPLTSCIFCVNTSISEYLFFPAYPFYHSLSVSHSVQSLSCGWLFASPWIAARQASLSITNSQSLLKLMPIKSVMPSSHLILCRPLLLLPPIPPSIRVFSNESTLRMRWPKYWSFSFSISPSNEHPGLISFRMDWLDLLAVQRDSQESSPTPQFKSINFSALSFLHSPTLFWMLAETKYLSMDHQIT